MRALADPDAFPDTDLVLKRLIEQRALQPTSWKPWRAYAALHLWSDYAEENA
jgi:AraC family transcriptional regulator of adaptative response / DNA-3-methyladenine glycosylase II